MDHHRRDAVLPPVEAAAHEDSDRQRAVGVHEAGSVLALYGRTPDGEFACSFFFCATRLMVGGADLVVPSSSRGYRHVDISSSVPIMADDGTSGLSVLLCRGLLALGR